MELLVPWGFREVKSKSIKFMTTNITLKGLHCSACKKLTERRISTISGVTSVNVNSDTGDTEIVANNLIQKSQVEAVLTDTGYSVA